MAKIESLMQIIVGSVMQCESCDLLLGSKVSGWSQGVRIMWFGVNFI